MSNCDEVVLIGDFNLGFISWEKDTNSQYLKPSGHNNILGNIFVDFLLMNNLQQFNSVTNEDNRMLDLILSTISGTFVEESISSLSNLDPKHPALVVSFLNIKPDCLKSSPRLDYNFYKADFETICLELSNINWLELFNTCKDVNEMVAALYSTLFEIIDRHVPKRMMKNSKYPIWFSKAFIKLLSEKEKIRKRYTKYKNPRDKLEYNLLRERSHIIYDECYSRYKKTIESDIIKNPKTFWRFIKHKRGNDNSLPATMYL